MPEHLAELISTIDAQRSGRGFMSVAQLLEALTGGGNVVLDPFSTLISQGVDIGRGNTFYPNVIIEATNGGAIMVGTGNVFYPGTMLQADGGTIKIGDRNQLGGGGLNIFANTPEAGVEIGSDGRYMLGADITAPCLLGSGTQILGAISAQNCRLEAGGSYQEADPERRGGVLKGCGRARNLIVKQGEVINGHGSFSQSQVESQLAYHPRAR